MADPSEPEQPLGRLHLAHLIALRAAPFTLWAVGIYLVLIGTLGSQPEPNAITSQVLGVVLLTAGALVTRAKSLDLNKEGVKADMAAIGDLDRVITIAVTPDSEQSAEIRGSGASGTTVLKLLEAAELAGWTVDRPRGVKHVTLTGMVKNPQPGAGRFGVGDSLTMTFPVGTLTSPVPPHVAAAMEAAGFAMPS